MKITLLIALTFLVNSYVVAQDIIVTKEADTIRCIIDKIYYDKVQLSFKNEKGVFVYSELSKDELVSCYYNYNSATKSGSKYVNFERQEGVLFLGLMLGTSFRMGEVTNRVNPSEDPKKNGLLVSIQLGYYTNKNIGLGFTYSNRHSTTSNSGAIGSGYEKINIRYFAPTVFLKNVADKGLIFKSSFSFGLISYQNQVEYSVAPDSEYFGTSLGIGGNLIIGYQLTRTISLSAVAGVVFGQVNVDLKDDTQTLIGPDKETVSSFDLGLSLVYLFK